MKVTIKVEEQGKPRGLEYKIYRVNGGKECKASRLEALERVRGGEKVISRVRKRKPVCSSRLSRSYHVSHYHELMSLVWPVRR